MKTNIYLILTILFLSVSCKNDNKQIQKEKGLIEKEKELIQKEKGLIEKEKELIQEEKKWTEKKMLEEKIKTEQKKLIKLNKHPDIAYIKKSFLGRETSDWRFDALSEFRYVRIIEEVILEDYYEAKLKIGLKDYITAQRSIIKLLVNYRKINGKWELQIFNQIAFTDE